MSVEALIPLQECDPPSLTARLDEIDDQLRKSNSKLELIECKMEVAEPEIRMQLDEDKKYHRKIVEKLMDQKTALVSMLDRLDFKNMQLLVGETNSKLAATGNKVCNIHSLLYYIILYYVMLYYFILY